MLTAFIQKGADRPSKTNNPELLEPHEKTVSDDDINKLMSAFSEAMSASSTVDIVAAYLYNDSGRLTFRHFICTNNHSNN